MSKNYQFFMELDLSEYKGEWVVICNQKLVSHGKDLKGVYEKAKRAFPKEVPFVAKVPRNV